MKTDRLHALYGPAAVIAGGSEGIGAAFAERLAGAGFDLVLMARREGPLEEASRDLETRFGVTVRTAALDLTGPDSAEEVSEWVLRADAGLFVFNAAASPIGRFRDQEPGALEAVVDLNCRSLVRVVRAVVGHLVVRALEERVRGGIILMSSLVGVRGASNVATYAASKAFTTELGESLYRELAPHHVDVLTCVAGSTDTPGFRATAGRPVGGVMQPGRVAKKALGAIGRKPVTIPGAVNRLASSALTRMLPRRAAISILSRQTEKLDSE